MTFPMALPFTLDRRAGHGNTQAGRGVFPNAAGIDVGASSHWVAVPAPWWNSRYPSLAR